MAGTSETSRETRTKPASVYLSAFFRHVSRTFGQMNKELKLLAYIFETKLGATRATAPESIPTKL